MTARCVLATSALAVTAIAALVACNAILGNEPRRLDGNDGSSGGTDGDGRDGGESKVDATTGDGGCNADLSADSENCGACGHSCMGGTCTSGKCGPFTVVSGQKNPSFLVVSGGSAYWTNADGRVLSCAVTGCNGTPKTITGLDAGNPFPSGLDVRGSTVYVTGYYTHAIHSCPTAGCAAPTTLAGNLDNPEDMRVDDTSAFFVSANGAWIGRCRLPSCAGGAIRVTSPGTAAWHGMTTDDANVYWYMTPNSNPTKGSIFRVAKNAVDASAEELLANVISPGAIKVKDGTLFMTYGGSVVVKVSLAPGLLQFPLASKENGAGDIAVDDTYVYWTSQGKGEIRRCLVSGCNGAPESIATGQNSPFAVVVDDKAVYWTEYLGGTVKGVAK